MKDKKKQKKKINTFLGTDGVNFCLFVLYEGIHTNTNKIISTEVIPGICFDIHLFAAYVMKRSHYLISDKNLDSVYGLLICKYSCTINVNSEENIKKKDRFVFFLVGLHFIAMRDYSYIKPFISKKLFLLDKLHERMNHFTD